MSEEAQRRHGANGASCSTDISPVIFRKDTTWRHEKEYRIVILIDPATPDQNILTPALFTWKFPIAVVRKIHLGEYASADTEAAVKTLSNGIPVLRQIA